MDLVRFNALPDRSAVAELTSCCSSPSWAARMASSRPFATVAELIRCADLVLTELDDDEVNAALAGHLRIGEHPVHESSRREQAGIAIADASLRTALARANRDYEARFGHVYLVCADGRSGEELLGVLRERLGNDAATERRVLRDELVKINRIRLARLVGA
ncbi:MAG: 2-oxo-4-hydroxy-4-carboxy-5-ureidoimidazoline decarboxylase [Pseudonocardiales bacterium]|nr:2-oxo-4-hydroxy-4-carboxy-5-ureidoimidazoline decarboxylase [Actinomycetota bacterium]PZS13405.1 MAG: 2-oxo-4-hydroxy-4-carboxy-5-ureidoimidazoline decarboxylase [Pseudonocardiales bacterium]